MKSCTSDMIINVIFQPVIGLKCMCKCRIVDAVTFTFIYLVLKRPLERWQWIPGWARLSYELKILNQAKTSHLHISTSMRPEIFVRVKEFRFLILESIQNFLVNTFC